MVGRVEPLFFIVTQSQNNRPRIECSVCGKMRYWAKAQKHPSLKGCFMVMCSNCRLQKREKLRRKGSRKNVYPW